MISVMILIVRGDLSGVSTLVTIYHGIVRIGVQYRIFMIQYWRRDEVINAVNYTN